MNSVKLSGKIWKDAKKFYFGGPFNIFHFWHSFLSKGLCRNCGPLSSDERIHLVHFFLVESGVKNFKMVWFHCDLQEMLGKFMLSFLPRLTVHHEYITVMPDGFRFQRQMFHSFNALLLWLKKHFREQIPHTPGLSTVDTNKTSGGFSVASMCQKFRIARISPLSPFFIHWNCFVFR
jgi:transcription elongation factor SPT6